MQNDVWQTSADRNRPVGMDRIEYACALGINVRSTGCDRYVVLFGNNLIRCGYRQIRQGFVYPVTSLNGNTPR